MKRKLDSNDIPMPAPEAKNGLEEESFAGLGLDSRLLQGIARQKFQRPTPVQLKAIPLVLQGRDVLARARTGTGKTAAYLLPIIQLILKRKETFSQSRTSSLILVPTRELAEQVYKAVESFAAFCAKDIRAINLTQKVSEAVQRSILADYPDIVIATPARAFANLKSSALSLESLSNLVIDEADLVLSYGYDEDLQNVAKSLPKGVQTILMSATLTNEVETLKGIFCRDPIILELDETEVEGEGVSQYVVKCAEDEKFLLIYVIFKLNLIRGKCIVFVGDIDRCYRLKLYLEQFGTKSCILNSELPVNSRIHVVEEFNKNVYDIIIASDEHEILGDEGEEEPPEVGHTANGHASKGDTVNELAATEHTANESAATGHVANESTTPGPAAEEPTTEHLSKGTKKSKATATADGQESGSAPPPPKKRKGPKKDKEYGISRGIDFKNVACVLNFDLPTSSKSYTHRIGRTARAGQTGMALSFVVPSELYRKHKPTTVESARNDEVILAKIIKHQAKKGKEVKPYNFDMKQVEAFRYRMDDALRAVTRVAIREARTRELREELIKSEKLKRHFEENPNDLHHLRHDGELRPARVQPHMRHVPEYLLPKEGQKAITQDVGFVGIRKTSENRIRKARMFNKAKGKGKRAGRNSDPLKTFKVTTRK